MSVLCTFPIPANPSGLLSASCPDYLYDCKFSAQYRRSKTKDDGFKLLVYGSFFVVMGRMVTLRFPDVDFFSMGLTYEIHVYSLVRKKETIVVSTEGNKCFSAMDPKLRLDLQIPDSSPSKKLWCRILLTNPTFLPPSRHYVVPTLWIGSTLDRQRVFLWESTTPGRHAL